MQGCGIIRVSNPRGVDGEVFIAVGGGPLIASSKYRQVSYSSLASWVKEYCDTAKLERVLNPHSFRHLGTVEMAKKNYNPYVMASVLGHRSIQSTMSYARLYGPDLEQKYYDIKGGA